MVLRLFIVICACFYKGFAKSSILFNMDSYKMKKTIAIVIMAVMICPVATMMTAYAATAETLETPPSLKPIEKIEVRFENREGILLAGIIFYPGWTGNWKLPAVVIVPGFACHKEDYFWLADALVENGYVAISIDGTGQADIGGAHPLSEMSVMPYVNDVSDAITYLTTESPVADIVDAEKIAIAGHSYGGGTVTVAAVVDERVKACIMLSPIMDALAEPKGYASKSRCPTIVLDGHMDGVLVTVSNAVPIYRDLNSPKQLILIEGGTHMGFTNIYPVASLLEIPTLAWQIPVEAHYCVAWLDYYLKGDESAYKRIITPIPHLSRFSGMAYDFGPGKASKPIGSILNIVTSLCRPFMMMLFLIPIPKVLLSLMGPLVSIPGMSSIMNILISLIIDVVDLWYIIPKLIDFIPYP